MPFDLYLINHLLQSQQEYWILFLEENQQYFVVKSLRMIEIYEQLFHNLENQEWLKILQPEYDLSSLLYHYSYQLQLFYQLEYELTYFFLLMGALQWEYSK
jgi:hypothetical protein